MDAIHQGIDRKFPCGFRSDPSPCPFHACPFQAPGELAVSLSRKTFLESVSVSVSVSISGALSFSWVLSWAS